MTATITAQEGEALYTFVSTVCKEIGPRMPCSTAEARAAELIKAEMQKTCDDVAIEPFTCAPGGLLGWIRIDIVLVAISFIFYLATPHVLPGTAGIALYGACIALVLAAWVITWKQFFSYEEFIDRFFKKASSQNVVGRIMPASDITRVIAFSGHHDSAPRYNLLEYAGGVGYGVVILWGFGILGLWTATLLVAALQSIMGADIGETNEFSAWLMVIGSPALLILWFFKTSSARGNVVPGAVDNLSAVSIVIAIGKYVRAHPEIVPENTEIRLLSFGCEEAGLRGAYRYVEAHRDELKNENFQLVNMDGLQSPKSFMIFSFEPTTRTPHDPRVTRNLIDAAKGAGVEVHTFGNHLQDKIAGFFSGGTDAAAFSKEKIPACSFGAMDVLKYVNNYHTSRDSPDRIEPGTLEAALRICLNYIENEKKHG